MTAESRDFSVATYSVESLTGVARRHLHFHRHGLWPARMRIRRAVPRASEGGYGAGNRQQEKTLPQNSMISSIHEYRYPPQEMTKNHNTEQKTFGESLERKLDGVAVQALVAVYYKIHPWPGRTQNNRSHR